jgi:hypothetical protein
MRLAGCVGNRESTSLRLSIRIGVINFAGFGQTVKHSRLIAADKNWLFANCQRGATASAKYRLIETAKANNVEPYAYLKKSIYRITQSNNCSTD